MGEAVERRKRLRGSFGTAHLRALERNGSQNPRHDGEALACEVLKLQRHHDALNRFVRLGRVGPKAGEGLACAMRTRRQFRVEGFQVLRDAIAYAGVAAAWNVKRRCAAGGRFSGRLLAHGWPVGMRAPI